MNNLSVFFLCLFGLSFHIHFSITFFHFIFDKMSVVRLFTIHRISVVFVFVHSFTQFYIHAHTQKSFVFIFASFILFYFVQSIPNVLAKSTLAALRLQIYQMGLGAFESNISLRASICQ